MNLIALPVFTAQFCYGWCRATVRRLQQFLAPALHQPVLRMAGFASVFDNARYAQVPEPVVSLPAVAGQQSANLAWCGHAVLLNKIHYGQLLRF
ncbi:hypothetical protein ACOZ0U_000898 [Cronobacter malonaticus]